MRIDYKRSLYLVISVVAVFMIALLMSHIGLHEQGKSEVTLLIESNRWLLFFIRSLLIVIFAMLWPYFARHCSKKCQLNEKQTQELVSRQWRLAMWLFIINIIFQLT